MSDINTSKADGNTVSASEFNQLAEIDNLISTSGQTPSTTNLEQISIGSARYSSAGQFYTDGGTANAYVLSPVSPFKSPVSATAGEGYFNGMIICFRAGNANTGASTVNVNGAGVKNLLKQDGTALSAGDISSDSDVKFRYNGTSFLRVLGKATTTTQGISYINNPITIANNATDANNDIDFSAGNFQFSDGSGEAVATAIMTKRLDATWSAGTNQGGLLNGTAVPKANNSTYHCYAIYNPTNNVIDFAFLLGVSGTAPDPTSVLPSGYTKFKLIASILTDGSGNIRTGKYTFFYGGYEFTYNNKVADATLVSLTTTKTPLTVSCPAGVRVKGSFNVLCDGIVNAKDSISLFEGGTSIENAKTSGGTLLAGANSAFGGTLPCYTNLSRQIEWKTDNYTLSTYLWTFGFTHYTN